MLLSFSLLLVVVRVTRLVLERVGFVFLGGLGGVWCVCVYMWCVIGD